MRRKPSLLKRFAKVILELVIPFFTVVFAYGVIGVLDLSYFWLIPALLIAGLLWIGASKGSFSNEYAKVLSSCKREEDEPFTLRFSDEIRGYYRPVESLDE